MDEFADILGTIFEIRDGFSEIRPEEPQPPFVYERYLCGGPKTLDVNDR